MKQDLPRQRSKLDDDEGETCDVYSFVFDANRVNTILWGNEFDLVRVAR